jgi:hypothetical protein
VIRTGTLADALDVAQRLRWADRAEIVATTGEDPLGAVLRSANAAHDLRAWVLNGQVEVIGGCRTIAPGVALPWMVGTDAMFGSAKWPFARSSRAEMDRWNSLWPLLSGHVHAANTAHVRWLQWCGFEVSDPIPWGASREPFHPFVRRAHVH